MAFLTLNGMNIPIAASGTIQPREIGGRDQAFGGNILVDRRAIKRRWRFLTSQLTETEFKLIEGILLSKGQMWSFDDHVAVDDTPIALPYSTKGMVSEGTFGGEYAVVNGAVGSHPVFDENGNTDAKSEIALHTSDAFTNDVSSNIARGGDTGGDTIGFAVLGAGSIAYSTSGSWKGNGSILVTPSGADTGVTLTPITLTLVTAYLITFYVRLATSDTIKVRLRGDTSTNAWTSVAVTGDRWQRVVVVQTLPSPNANAVIDIASFGGNSFFLDGVFTVDSWAAPVAIPPWASTSYVANRMKLPISLITGPNLSISAWVQMGWSATSEAEEHLISITTALYTDALELRRDSFSSSFTLYFRDSTGTVRTGTSTSLFASSAWHHIAVVMTSSEVVFYVNGVEVSSWSAIPAPTIFSVAPKQPKIAYLGYKIAGNEWRGKIDELLVLPYPLSQEIITAMQTSTFAELPNLKMSGDCIPDPSSVDVLPMVQTESYVTGRIAGTWTPNQRQISFELTEV